MSLLQELDAHSRPPEVMRRLFKKYQKCKVEDLRDLRDHPDFIDIDRVGIEDAPQLCPASESRLGDPDAAFQSFLRRSLDEPGRERPGLVPALEVKSIPGLYFFPNLLSPDVQLALLGRLLHRDLSNPDHRTNVHLHHHISSPPLVDSCRASLSTTNGSSFFSQNKVFSFPPKDPTVHKTISIAEFLERKLRWMTLGGQYDWTAKRYPSASPPPFPADIKRLLKGLFPDMDAQAAIANFYSPGDTLCIHRDVSEFCDQGLVSISVGCDAIFIVGNQDATETATMRLRSGDTLYMTGSSRYAWHGVPKIIPNTCPDWLREWPAIQTDDNAPYNDWRGWMSNKRINLNVRQMTTPAPQSRPQETGELSDQQLQQ